MAPSELVAKCMVLVAIARMQRFQAVAYSVFKRLHAVWVVSTGGNVWDSTAKATARYAVPMMELSENLFLE
jgi:hypothetical protein